MNKKKDNEEKKEYIEAVGRRKTAVARVRIFPGQKGERVNDKELKNYFPSFFHQQKVLAPLNLLNLKDQFLISVKVRGGGLNAQAEATRLALSRALTLYQPEWRKALKSAGFLKRDPRERERKKFGLKRARRAPQWQKR